MVPNYCKKIHFLPVSKGLSGHMIHNIIIIIHIIVCIYSTVSIIEVSLKLNLLGEEGEETATVGLEPRVSDCNCHNH